jgi:hypothetical protein
MRLHPESILDTLIAEVFDTYSEAEAEMILDAGMDAMFSAQSDGKIEIDCTRAQIKAMRKAIKIINDIPENHTTLNGDTIIWPTPYGWIFLYYVSCQGWVIACSGDFGGEPGECSVPAIPYTKANVRLLSRY